MEARWYQADSNAAAWRWILDGKGNPLIVMPTGAGKSIVIALLIQQAVQWGQRVLVLAHRKELLEQNADKIQRLKAIMDAVGVARVSDSQQLHNRQLTVTLDVREYDGKLSNEVKGYAVKRSSGQPMTQTSYPAPAGQMANPFG